MNFTYNTTIRACFVAYIVQAILNNFLPLLFVHFQNIYGLSLGQLSFLILGNFLLQLTVDLLSAKYADKIGYRKITVISHFSVVIGFVLLTILPSVMSPFWGILIAVAFYAVGGGVIEVLISPIVESCPTKNKEAAMSLLHSFYCWGHMAVILLSTLFFYFFGLIYWKILAFLWALVPLVNGVLFTKVSIIPLIKEGEQGMSAKKLFSTKMFYYFLLFMVCSGASEQAVSQWASAFAEQGLGVSKTLGDLIGPMSFAFFMGLSRWLYGKFGEKINLYISMIFSALLCILAYTLVIFSPYPLLSLFGCSLCGFSVGLFWPGTLSLAAYKLPLGGTAMFAFLALAGDLGCASGPGIAGIISGIFGDQHVGFMIASLFPIIMITVLTTKRKKLM